MSNAQMLRKHHQGLHQIANELEKCLAQEDVRTRPQAAAIWLSRLTGLLALHLALEDKVMYPRLLGHRDWEVGSRARGCVAEVGGMRDAFEAYRKRWSRPAAIGSEWDAFAKDSRTILEALRARIRLEDREIYSLLEKAAA